MYESSLDGMSCGERGLAFVSGQRHFLLGFN